MKPPLPPRRRPKAAPLVSLVRALSKLGFCTRTEAVALIRGGRVKLNGRVCTDPTHRILLKKNRIAVDGRLVTAASGTYIMLNKPRGVVTTRSDEHDRDTVYSCLPDPQPQHLIPVGRLDKASEGLLLLTNDTAWAARILDPRSHIEKIYDVHIDRLPDPKLLRRMVDGVRTKEGETLSFKRVRVLRQAPKTAWLEVILEEGRNRHIRRVLEALDTGVLRLIRTAIGSLTLGELPKGHSRPLSTKEKKRFDEELA
jgi:23S rRNA pseudouridine2605 synthase